MFAPVAAAAANGNGASANGHHAAADGEEAAPPGPAQKRLKTRHALPAAVVLDIEGTVAPISFVADVMFPYARKHCRAYLEAAFGTAEAQEDVQAIREQVGPLALELGRRHAGRLLVVGRLRVGAVAGYGT